MIFYGTLVSSLFKYNFKLLTAKNIFYTQKTPFDSRMSSRGNFISKNIFTKYHAIYSVLFGCTQYLNLTNHFVFTIL